MTYRFFYIVFILVVFANCKSETKPKKDSSVLSAIDSIEFVNSQSIQESGDNVTKAYVDIVSEEFSLWADMKKDHRFYGFEKPDINSKRLILFSIFTNDVEGNPFELPYGSYYDTRDSEDDAVTISFVDELDDFIETDIESTNGIATVYFEKKWIILEGDEEDETIREYGKVVKFEDGPYPIYIVTVDFVERNFTMDFNLNIEAMNIDGETLNNLPGKYVTIDYTSELIDDLNDIHFEGKSLYGKYAPEMDSSWNQFTGILSGASSLSGDLPNLVTITNTDGETKNFELYVDDEVIKANGKEVTVFHSIRSINTITGIQPSLD